METWLEWARGPIFRFAFLLMVLGIIRVITLNLLEVRDAFRRAGDKRIPMRVLFRDTAKRLLLHRSVSGNRVPFTLVSVVFHITVIITPIFLGAHVLLWERGLGLSWPALRNSTADVLTLLAVASALALFILRLYARAARSLSRFQDFALPAVFAVVFGSGYLAMHPALNPFSYEAALLVHVMGGNLVLVMVPFSKLAHVVLFPMTQLVTELGWHLAPRSGWEVAVALGKENEPI